MGIIPTPITPGDDCVLCFTPGFTPTLFKCFFSGIKTGDLWHPGLPPSPNGYFDLIQVPGIPCRWYSDHPDYSVRLIYDPAWSSLFVETIGGAVAFSSTPVAICTTYYANAINTPVNQHYYDGWGLITTPQQLQAWIELATPITGPDPRMECFPMEDGQIVVKFCNIQDGTNIKIKLDTALL